MTPHGRALVSETPILAMTVNSTHLWTAHDDGAVRCWNLASGMQVWLTTHPGPVTALQLIGDQQLVAVGSNKAQSAP